jgi:hypothetical protein
MGSIRQQYWLLAISFLSHYHDAGVSKYSVRQLRLLWSAIISDVSHTRRKIRLIEGDAKCCHIKKFL